MDLPKADNEVIANEKVSDDKNIVAFEYGPLVYCAEEIDNKNISKITIPDNVELMPQEEIILLNKIIAIKGKANGEEFKLISYYLWSKRRVGKMKVWFPNDIIN